MLNMQRVTKMLIRKWYGSEIYNMNESLNKKNQNGRKQKVPMIVVIGDESY